MRLDSRHNGNLLPPITARPVAFIRPLTEWTSAMPQQRSHFRQSLEERLAEEAERLHEQAKLLPPRAVRDRTIANMDWASEQACRVFPHGGDHERRRYVAQKLKLGARNGNITLDELTAIANAAVDELTKTENRLAGR